MRLLRHTGAPLLFTVLVTSFSCTIIQQLPPDDDESTGAESSTTRDDTTTTSDDTTGTPPDDTTTSGADSTSTAAVDSSTDGGNQGQACGNGVIEGTEQCDCGGMPCSPAGLDGMQCAGLVNTQFPDRVYTGGILDCSAASCQFVFTTCTYCGDENLNGNEICEQGDNGPSCQDLGLGSSTQDLPCGPACQWHVECCEPDAPKELDCD
jgi:hypothetical protein